MRKLISDLLGDEYAYRLLLFLLLFFNATDAISTATGFWVAPHLNNVEIVEANPIWDWCIQRSIWFFIIVKILFGYVMCYFAERIRDRWHPHIQTLTLTLIIGSSALAYVSMSNTLQLVIALLRN